VFAVNQQFVAKATFQADRDEIDELDPDGTIENPTLEFNNARIDGEEAKLHLSPAEEQDYIWCGSAKICYYKPGIAKLDYDHEIEGHTELIKIELARTYFEYQNSRFVLLFGVITAIFAAGSLVVALQTI
jgi:hypothetical protein